MEILFIRRKLRNQNRFGFYISGIMGEQNWYGLELPWLDIRIVKYIGKKDSESDKRTKIG